jgi:hypothetical protein
MEPTQSSETLAYKIQTPGKFPEDYILQLQHSESLKTTRTDSVWLTRSFATFQPNKMSYRGNVKIDVTLLTVNFTAFMCKFRALRKHFR